MRFQKLNFVGSKRRKFLGTSAPTKKNHPGYGPRKVCDPGVFKQVCFSSFYLMVVALKDSQVSQLFSTL